MKNTKNSRQLERHLKGVANHYRIEIILFLERNPGATLEQIYKQLKANQKTIGEHTRRLAVAGLLQKTYSGSHVEHRLSPYGKIMAKFLNSFRSL